MTLAFSESAKSLSSCQKQLGEVLYAAKDGHEFSSAARQEKQYGKLQTHATNLDSGLSNHSVRAGALRPQA